MGEQLTGSALYELSVLALMTDSRHADGLASQARGIFR
jgi:hypothetical protein